MDRPIVYTQELGRAADFLGGAKAAMFGLGFLAQACLGSSLAISGLALAQTGVASLNLLVSSGSIYAIAAADATQYGTLAADATLIVKQGILAPATTQIGPFTPPATAGFSTNYLVQAAYQDVDTGAVVPPFYNSANPTVPLVGQGGLGAQNFTIRQGALIVSTKAGIAAATGSQATPAADAGFTPLYVVTVANGATALTSLNFVTVPSAPFIPATLPAIPAGVQNMTWSYAAGTGTASALAATISPAPAALTAGMMVLVKMPFTNGGAMTFNLNGLGVKSALARDGTQLNAGDAANGSLVALIYNGTAWQLLSDRSSALTFTVADASLWHVGTATGGTANAQTTTLAPVPATAAVGLSMRVPITSTNTGPLTLDFGFGPKNVVLNGNNAALVGGEVIGGIGYIADLEFDGTVARLMNPAPAYQGRSLGVQTFSVAGVSTYVPTPGTRYCVVTVVGSGGAGQGCVNPPAGNFAMGGGGGGGGYAVSKLLTSTAGVVGATITVPAKAVAVYGAPTNPAPSGATASFGAFLSATGGQGGGGAGSVANGNSITQGGGAGGQGSGGNIVNGVGQAGTSANGSSSSNMTSGAGGGTVMGFGASPIAGPAGGLPGISPGSGGSGGCQSGGNPAQVGGSGADGYVKIEDFS